MPIRQERMLALIKAALDYQQGLENMARMYSTETGREIRASFSLITPDESAATIAREDTHFRLRRRTNRRNAEYMARKRGARLIESIPDDGPRKFDPWRQLSDMEQIKRDILDGKYTPDPAIRAMAEEAARLMNSTPEPTHTYNPDAPPRDSSPVESSSPNSPANPPKEPDSSDTETNE